MSEGCRAPAPSVLTSPAASVTTAATTRPIRGAASTDVMTKNRVMMIAPAVCPANRAVPCMPLGPASVHGRGAHGRTNENSDDQQSLRGRTVEAPAPPCAVVARNLEHAGADVAYSDGIPPRLASGRWLILPGWESNPRDSIEEFPLITWHSPSQA